MKLLILTTLLVIVVFTFLLINYNSYHSNESFQNTGYSQCVFMPTTINGGFGSLLACKDYCRNPDKYGGFGCALSREKVCENICKNCTDTQMCRWNTTEPALTENKVPKKIELEYIIRDNNVLLRWEKPESSEPLDFYSIIIRDSRYPSESEIELNNEVNVDFVEHLITELRPLRTYYITIYGRNRFGYSKESNSVRVQLPYRGNTGYTGFALPTSNPIMLEDLRNQLRQSLTNNNQQRNVHIDQDRPLSPLEILTLYNQQKNTISDEINIDFNVNMAE